jgi:hypothetical protein
MHAQQRNVTSCRGKIITNTFFALTPGFLHHVPPVSRPASISQSHNQIPCSHSQRQQNQTFGLEGGFKVRTALRRPF